MTTPITDFHGDNLFLSNFWKLNAEGSTTEHLFQASKTLDLDQRLAVLTAATPGDAKKMGRTVTLRPDWDDIKFQVMADIQAQKFSQPELRTRLVSTGNAYLIEGNNWGDRYWGAEFVNDGVAPPRWVGENNLGKILMAVRATLRAAL